jgi:hypothetical protein
MAAPPYFSPVKFGQPRWQQTFIGGPRGANNPTRELLKEASAIFGEDKLVGQIVSLGSGRSHVYSVERNTDTEGVDRFIQEMAADCDAVAKELSTRLCDLNAYLRLNVDRGMENLVMNEWDDLGPIETHTSAYIESTEISKALDASLRRLQGGAGTVTLGEISAYSHTLSEPPSKAHSLMEVRSSKHRPGRARKTQQAQGRFGPYIQEYKRQW